MAELICFHVQDSLARPVNAALVQGDGVTKGHWQGLTNPCGDFLAMLDADHYTLTVSAQGLTTRTLPADLANSGIITIGLDGRPFSPAPHAYQGNMCGVRVSPGLPPVPGGAGDSSLVLSWFVDRYLPSDRSRIYQTWIADGDVDVLVSWPDSRSRGATPDLFVATCTELVDAGLRPCVFLCSKDFDPADVPAILSGVLPLLSQLIATGVAPRVCVGWELSLWLSPTQVQQLIDAIAPVCVSAGVKCYVHFQSGYFAFQQPGHVTADFWATNVGKLTGILHQRDPNEDKGVQSEYVARISDCLQRFAGGFGFPKENGIDGQPFDFIACEITADEQFNGQMDEATGNSWGRASLSTPPVGVVKVQGSGNGS